ncbi:thioredoxin domain-containing protein [Photobacterium leiognathi]|uniref:hypothetical protein n=1 Tax=Photobacterium leiognathi TaxID=553611 RepID=UPI002982317C|nr:hypothetical protein [Photobacterium leiognathi]
MKKYYFLDDSGLRRAKALLESRNISFTMPRSDCIEISDQDEVHLLELRFEFHTKNGERIFIGSTCEEDEYFEHGSEGIGDPKIAAELFVKAKTMSKSWYYNTK